MEQNEKKQFQCSGDCLRCLPVQRQYCAAQHAYNSMMMIKEMQNSLFAMTGTIEELRIKIDAIQNSEGDVFNPLESIEEEEIAQVGDGAEKIDAPK